MWSDVSPRYILPSQPPTGFNREAAEYYRKNDNYRAIAYYMEGYLCSLIDGHHKAAAAALEQRSVKTLVIIPATRGFFRSKHLNESLNGIMFNKIKLYENEMITPFNNTLDLFKYNRMSSNEVKEHLSLINEDFDRYEWDKDILDTERYYPDAVTFARIEWAGGISDDRLDEILNHQIILSDDEVLNLVTALHALGNPRFKEIAFHFGKIDAFFSVWIDIFTLLSEIRDEEVENFFIHYLINAEIERRDLKKIVDNYLGYDKE